MILTFTGLENHPLGTSALNGIVNANWERLEAIWTPLGTAAVDGAIGWDTTGKVFTYRAPQAAVTYAASVAIAFNGALSQTIALTGNLTLTTSNLAVGRRVTVIITADASVRTLAFPAWKFLGAAAPTNIAASKTGLLELWSTGTTDANVLARWTVQP